VILGTGLQHGLVRDRAWRLRLPVVHNAAYGASANDPQSRSYKFECRPVSNSSGRICFLWYRVYFPAAELIEPAAVS
jgi:hypothetical protein